MQCSSKILIYVPLMLSSDSEITHFKTHSCDVTGLHDHSQCSLPEMISVTSQRQMYQTKRVFGAVTGQLGRGKMEESNLDISETRSSLSEFLFPPSQHQIRVTGETGTEDWIH